MQTADPEIAEIHTGARVRAEVERLMQEASINSLNTLATSKEKRARVSEETWERMLQKLPEHERASFRAARAVAIDNLFFMHYNAVYRRLNPAT